MLTAHQELNVQILDEYASTFDSRFIKYIKSGSLSDHEDVFKNIKSEIDLIESNIKRISIMGDDDLYIQQESEHQFEKTQHIKLCKSYDIEQQRYNDKQLVLSCIKHNTQHHPEFNRVITRVRTQILDRIEQIAKPDSELVLYYMSSSDYKKSKLESLNRELGQLTTKLNQDLINIEECRDNYVRLENILKNFDVYTITVSVNGGDNYIQPFYDDRTKSLNEQMWRETKGNIIELVIKNNPHINKDQFSKRLNLMALEQRMFHNKYPDQGYEIKIEYIL